MSKLRIVKSRKEFCCYNCNQPQKKGSRAIYEYLLGQRNLICCQDCYEQKLQTIKKEFLQNIKDIKKEIKKEKIKWEKECIIEAI